jgi:hypothetical protein
VYLFQNTQHVVSGSSTTTTASFHELGGLKGYAANVPVFAADFSKCSRYLRIFGECKSGDKIVTIDYFDLATGVKSAPGAKITTAPELTHVRDNIEWNSVSSPGAAEARGAYTAAVRSGAAAITSISSSSDGAVIAVGYSDSAVRLYR